MVTRSVWTTIKRAAFPAGIVWSAIALVGCASTITKASGRALRCETLAECLATLETLETDKYGISPDEQNFAKSFTRFGEPALVELLRRLDIDDNREKIIGYAIASFDPIDEKYLPQIVDGVKKDVSWLARALGNIPTEKAAEAAVDAYLVSNSAPHNQEAQAVKKHGVRALPFILQRMQCGEICEDVRQGLLVYIIGEMDDTTKTHTAKEIIRRLSAPDISRANQAYLIALFFNMGPQGLIVESDLEDLAQDEPKLAPQIEQAFVGIHSKNSGKVFAEWIRQDPNRLILRDVAELGPAAQDAGPAIIPLLSSEDPEIRVAAARSLGFLQYRAAEKGLIAVLNDTRNIQLNWVAVNALGRIGSKSSIPVLKKVADEHWYPAVRDQARLAITHVREGVDYDSKFHKDNFAFDFFDYQNLDVKSCKKVKLNPAPVGSSFKLTQNQDSAALESLTYSSYVIGYTAGDEQQQRAKDPDGIIVVNQNNMVEVREEVRKTPNVAIRTNQGWLTGYNGGEWGGELMFKSDSGDVQELLSANVADLFKFGDDYIAVTGLAHLSLNSGLIFRVFHESESWQIDPWITLPGAPRDSWRADTNEIVVDTYRGGTIIIGEDGSLRMAPCDEYEDD